MDEFQETFTNPFNIKCSSCGSPAEYDIIHQNYHCQHCGSVTELEAPMRAVERYRKLHEQELKAKKTSERLRKYNCPGCGAIVVLDSTEATGKCDFCGTKMVNSDFLESDAFPELIIPFKITLDEAKVELEKWLKENSSRPEAKSLMGRVNELQGYYLPYQVVKGPVKGSAYRARGFRKYEYGGFVDEVAVNTSSQLDNMLLDAMEPFDWREIRPFEYGYIAGMRTKLQDTNALGIAHRIKEEIQDAYLQTVEKTLQSADLETSLDISNVMQIPALMPVYFINNGVVKCAINGQTGRVSVTPLKQEVVQRAWLEPVLTMLFVAGLCEAVPVSLGFHASFELTGMISLVVGLIVWAAYGGANTVKKTVYLKSAKQLAKRLDVSNKLTFTDGKELIENPAKIPVFFEKIAGKVEPVVIKFYTASRAIKASIIALVLAFLPNVLAYVAVAYDVYLYDDPVERFGQIHHFYAAAWWTLMIPIIFILWIAVVRRDAFEYPVVYRIQPDGGTVEVEGLYKVDWSVKEMLVLLFCTSPVCWITFFILFMVMGCVAAMID